MGMIEPTYEAVQQAIDYMGSGSAVDGFEITPKCADRTSRILRALKEIGASPPKIFTLDEDDVVLTWETAEGKLYIIAGSEDEHLIIANAALKEGE